ANHYCLKQYSRDTLPVPLCSPPCPQHLRSVSACRRDVPFPRPFQDRCRGHGYRLLQEFSSKLVLDQTQSLPSVADLVFFFHGQFRGGAAVFGQPENRIVAEAVFASFLIADPSLHGGADSFHGAVRKSGGDGAYETCRPLFIRHALQPL